MTSQTLNWSIGKMRLLSGLAIVGLIGFQTGCRPDVAKEAEHEPNYLYSHAMALSQDVEMDVPLSDSYQLLNEWFGTPDNPKLPPLFAESDYKDLISLENIQMAAGPAPESTQPGERGLYQQLCASCHGVTGQGRGPVAASQNPYPREFRLGLFKFKSTHRNSKPVKSDIALTLRRGLTGSQMPLFDKLSEKQINALVDYVVYLSVRGEFERKLLANAAMELDLPTDRVYNVALKASGDDPKLKEQLENAKDLLSAVADTWVEAEDNVQEFDLPDFPIYGQPGSENSPELAASIAKGKALFENQVSACSKCHGIAANGEGTQQPDYDDWTKDWTAKIGIAPTSTDELMPLMARGGMKPQALKPRNIVEGKLRGGREPLDIYRKIRFGITGTPMPAAAIVSSKDEPGLMEEDLWHIVNYVLSIAQIPPPPVEVKAAG